MSLAIADDSNQLDTVSVSASVPDQSTDPLPEAATASRLGLTMRETPATVDIIGRDEIEQEGLRNLIELYRNAPGVSAGNIPGSPASVSMRGFTDVGYLFNGTRAVDPGLMSRNMNTWNLERVEILKGPASVLHGTGALAGSINLVTKRPDVTADSYDGMISYGSNDTVNLGVGANKVLTDTAALRADFSHDESDGFVDDTNSRTDAFTTGLLLTPTEKLTLSFDLDLYSDEYRTPYQGAPLLPASVARDPSDAVSGDLVLDESIRDNNYNVNNGVMESESQWFRARVDYQLNEHWKLANEMGFYNADRNWANSEDFTYNAGTGQLDRLTTIITHRQKSASERFYAAYDGKLGELRHRFTAGIDLRYTDFFSQRRFGDTTSVDPFNPDRGRLPVDNAGNYPYRVNYDSTVTTQGVFIEDALNLTPNWLLVGGARYDYSDLNRTIDDLSTDTSTDFGQTYESFSWRLGTIYDLTNNTQLFAQYNRAATPITSLVLSSESRAAFDLSKGRSMEAGVRTDFWDRRATLTAAVYRIDQDDILTRDPSNPALTVQGGSQRSEGGELDLTLQLLPQWWLRLSAAHVDAKYTELNDGSGNDLAGNRPTNVPDDTYTATSAYTFKPVALTVGGAIRHTGDFYTSSSNDYKVASRTLLDAWVSHPLGKGTLTLRGRNLTDEFYADWSGYSATQVYVGAPRTVELGWTGHF
ncbi:TonB-dependent siderophore receptor [Alcanivorax sp.]|jgi:iron complex outermembrane receptor protein|uniref:TonB-dependent receptor n=1 Tax=Alcanivorax sp. TaxID=1872427 RepID=UPI0032D93437